MTQNKDSAEKRTDWAEDRTILANERTFSSWNGLGLTAIGVAIGLRAVFKETEPTWAAQSVATIFLIVALAVFWSAFNQANKTHLRFRGKDASKQPRFAILLITLGLSAGAVGTGVILWSL